MKREAALIDLVASVVDGGTPDWATLERTAITPEERRALEQLRIVAGVAAVHISTALPEETGPAQAPEATGPASPDADARGGVARPLRVVSRAKDVWGHFELYECIGEGSYGKVYRAWDTRLHRQVAIKLLKLAARRPESGPRDGVLLEAQAIASVVHENVVAIHSVEQHDERVGLCMEFIEGQTLEQHLTRSGRFGLREATLTGLELCRALAAVHAAGLIHCDVKARNVMRSNAGRLVLMDFGAGVFSDDNVRLRRAGTPLYLAPEVLDGGPPTVQSDLYSLGVLLFFAVTGTHPVQARSVEDLHDAHRRNQRTHLSDHRPDLPDRFVQVIDRALDPDPTRRFQTAGAMRSALAESLNDLAVPAPSAVQPVARPAMPTLASPLPTASRPVPATATSRSLAAAAALVLLLVAVGWLAFRPWPGASAGDPGRRVAVIPLRNLTGGPDWQVDAATEDVMSAIGRIPGVLVTDWRSAARVADQPGAGVPEIARGLRAGWVMEGSVRRASMGGDLRLALELFDASGERRWSQTFEAPDLVVAGVPTQVATAVARQIGREAPAAPTSPVPPAEARAAYSQARFLMRNLGSTNDREALAHLERAVTIDPTFARAHAALALCLIRLESVGALPRADARERVDAALDRALALDDTLADAHTSRGNVRLSYDWDWSGAEAEYRRALELNPDHLDARVRYAYLLAAAGRTRDGLAEVRRALDVDPLAPHLGDVAMMLLYDRQYDLAIQTMRERLEQEPNQVARRYGLARALAAAGRSREAVVELQAGIDRAGGPGSVPVYDAELVRMLARHDPDGARRLLAPIEAGASGDTPVMLAEIGYIYVALGDASRAFSYLDRAADARAAPLLWAVVDERLDPVRQDPRFARLQARLNIPR